MRRAAAVGLLTAVAAFGCGGQTRAREVPARLAAPRACHVDIFLATRMVSGREATRAEIAAIRARLAASSRIRTYAFVSKRLALRRMAKRHPELVYGLSSNPLPAAYEVVPKAVGEARPLAAELRRAAGVEHVSSARGC